MAKPRSEDKRNAILVAATKVFAERGLSAPTAAISRAAGVAEGTLFTYFETKDELLNALYCEIKQNLADAMMSHFPPRGIIFNRLQHVWDSYVTWRVNNPLQEKVLRPLDADVEQNVNHAAQQAHPAGHQEVEGLLAYPETLPHPQCFLPMLAQEIAGGSKETIDCPGPRRHTMRPVMIVLGARGKLLFWGWLLSYPNRNRNRNCNRLARRGLRLRLRLG